MRLLIPAVLLATPVAALAAEHQMKVGEVMLSHGGSTTKQFVELQDPGESFPSGGYSLRLFDAAGANIGTIALTVPPGTTRLTIATAAAATALSFTADATLTVTLPTNGQACFSVANTQIHCLAWGTITSGIVGNFGSSTGASPPDGMSLQLVSGVYTVGTPSPAAANTAAVPDAFVPPDGGMPDAPSTAPDAPVGTPDAPGGNGNNPKDDDGCSVGASASWFALVGLVGLVALRRRRS